MNRTFMHLLIAVIAVLHDPSSAGTADPDARQKLQLKVDQTRLRLEDGNGMCSAVGSTEHDSATRYALGIPWPCHFHTDKAGHVRTLRGDGYVYALVEASKRTPNPSLDDCETHLQSIRIKGNIVEISPHMDRVASCPPFQWDTVLFKELFD